MEKTAIQGLIGTVMTPKSGYTPALGDQVIVSDDLECDACTDGALPAGEVFALEKASGNVAQKVTVQLYSARVREAIASGAVAAGNKIVAKSKTQVRAYNTGAPDNDTPDRVNGICLIGAADTGTVTYMVR